MRRASSACRRPEASLPACVTGAIQLVLIPVVGALSDRWGRLPIGLLSAAAILLAIYPLFAWLAAVPTLQTLLDRSRSSSGFCTAGYMGGLPALMAELFPTRMRTTGLSISYSFGVAIFGGFAPFINAWLIEATGSKLAPVLLSHARGGDQPRGAVRGTPARDEVTSVDLPPWHRNS